MSKAPGSPLQHAWKSSETHYNPNISQERKAKITFQLRVIADHLSRLHFDQAGSLFEEDEKYHIKTGLSRGLLLQGRHALEDIPRGPFKYEKNYYNAQILTFIEQAKYVELGHRCFFAPVPARSEYIDDTEFREASDR